MLIVFELHQSIFMTKSFKTLVFNSILVAFFLGYTLIVSAVENEKYKDSLNFLQSKVISMIETEETTNALDEVLKIEALLANSPELGSTELITINHFIKGLSAYNFLDYAEATIQADNAILNASESSDAIVKSLAEHIKGLTLYGLNNYPEAEVHFKNALKYLDEIPYANKSIFNLNRDAFRVDNYYYIAILNYAPALQWFNDAGKFVDRSQQESLEIAIKNAEETLTYISFSKARTDKRLSMYLLLADSHLKLNNIEEAKNHLASATNFLQHNSTTLLRHYWFNRCYAEYHEVNKDYEQSMLFYKRALELIRKHSINVNKEFKQNNKSSINYMTNQLSVSLMKTEKELTNSKEEKGVVLIAFVITTIATLLAIVIYQWRLVRLKNKLNQQLTIKNSTSN